MVEKLLSNALLELSSQNEEMKKRADALIIANKELVYQNKEKAKREQELVLANIELLHQNKEKEKRAIELSLMNKELEAFSFISSHDLQEPLRKIQTFSGYVIDTESENLSEKGRDALIRIQDAGKRMQSLIDDLLAYSRTSIASREFQFIDIENLIRTVLKSFEEEISDKNVRIEIQELCTLPIIPFQFRQMIHNLVSNALKFSKDDVNLEIKFSHEIIKGSETGHNVHSNDFQTYCKLSISDNGIGFDPEFKEYIFEVFKRLHDKKLVAGTGMGLTIVKKIVEHHNGFIFAEGEVNQGATFDIFLPLKQE